MGTAGGGRNVLLGVSGSIAAYKAADIASALVKMGHNVDVVMTRAATEFIGPLTLQTLSRNPVSVDLWEEVKGWQPGHIELADRAEVFLVAPATANVIANFAHGQAPDLLTSVYLATRARIVIAPAMNTKMLEHPATRRNIARLRSDGVEVLETDEGMLACGYEGKGKLSAVDGIVASVAEHLAR